MNKGLVHVGRHHIFEPKVRKVFGVHGDEVIAGFLYLTDLEEVPPKHRVKQTFNFKILELIRRLDK